MAAVRSYLAEDKNGCFRARACSLFCAFIPANVGVCDDCRAYLEKVAIHKHCQRPEMRRWRTSEGVEKWLCSVSEGAIRPDWAGSILDAHLLQQPLQRWGRPAGPGRGELVVWTQLLAVVLRAS